MRFAQLDAIFSWIRRASANRLFWLGLPLLLYSWTLTGPFIVDDLHLLLKAERYRAGKSASLDLYRFAKTDEEWNQLRLNGACPWWVTSGRLDFFRPVSEYSFYLDMLLFGRSVIGYRIVSLGIFACVLLVVHWMIETACGDSLRAGAATLFFGISQTVTLPVTWMCNRQDLLVALGVGIAGLAYWKLRDRAALRWIIIGTIGYLFALLSKELAIAMCAVVVVHEALQPRQSGSRMSKVYAGLVGVLSALYLLYYLTSRPWLATGANGPPSQLNGRWPLAILLYSAVWTLGFPIDLLLSAGRAQTWAVAGLGGLLAILVIRYLRRAARQDPAALFFALWVVAFMLPPLRALSASTRSLCVATIGWSYLLTGLILPAKKSEVVLPRWLRHWLYTANGVVSIGCAIGTVLFMNTSEGDARRRLMEICREIRGGLHEGDTLVVARAESAAEVLCSGDRLEYLTGIKNVSITHLLPADIDASMEIEDNRTVLLRAKDRSLFDSALHQLTLPPNWRAEAGRPYRLKDCTVQIADVTRTGGVLALRVRFNEPLTSGRAHFYPPPGNGLADAEGNLARAKGS